MHARTRAVSLIVAGLLVTGAVAVGFIVADEAADGPAPLTDRPALAPAGSLRVGVPELPATYNPFDLRARTPAATQVLSMVLPQLFDVSPEGEVQPRLVEPGSVEERGQEVDFELAEGARWSDGAPITVSDLQFTLDVVRSDLWPGPGAGYDAVESIDGQGREVTIRFERDLPGWERLFSGEDYVLPRHRLLDEDLASVWAVGPDVSGGPYELVGSTRGLDAVLTANQEWWGEGPGVKDLRVLTVPDATTLEQLFERGELDVIWVPAFTERIRELRGLEEVDVAVGEAGGRLLSVYANTEALEEEVRVATLDLVDRDRFVGVLLQDEASLATSWGHLRAGPGWPNWLIDPSKAEGLESSPDVRFAISEEQPMARLVTRAAQRQARDTEVGIDSVTALSELLDGEWLPEGTFDLAFVDEVQWPEPCWRCRFDSAFEGETAWPRVDGLGDLAAAADGGDAAAGSRLERRLQEEAVLLPMWRPRAVVASRGVEGIEANAWAFGPFYRPERWSPAG